MKFRVERDALADAVAWTAKSLPSRPSVPVLAGVMLRVAGDPQQGGAARLHLSGFDYEVANQVDVEIHEDAEGAALVSGRLLAEITKALPGKPVEIAAVGSHLELVCGSARFTLPTMPVEDYPTLPAVPATAGTVEAATFAAAVAQVAMAAGRDETLPMMTGVRLELTTDTLALLATDRYRLAIREIPWTPKDPAIDTHALVPARTLADTAKTLGTLGGDVTIALASGTPAKDAADGSGVGSAAEGMIGFVGGSRRTTSRLLDGQSYPPVRSLFAASYAAEARVPVAALVEVVKRVSLVAEKATPVRLSFGEDGLVVEAGGTEEARASEAMAAVFTGEPMTIAFNPQYLIEGLGALGAPTAVFAFNDPFKPAVLTPAGDDDLVIPGFRYLIMPIRVGR